MLRRVANALFSGAAYLVMYLFGEMLPVPFQRIKIMKITCSFQLQKRVNAAGCGAKLIMSECHGPKVG